MRRLTPALTLTILLSAGSALSQSVALVIGNEDYERVGDVRRADDVANAARDLERSGVKVVARKDSSLDDMQAALSEFGQMAERSEAMLVVLAGQFLHTATETYFLPVDADAGPLATLATGSLPLSTVTAWLADKPGRAFLVLATEPQEGAFGRFVLAGPGDIEIPQGVRVLTGLPRQTERFISEVLARPGRGISASTEAYGIASEGFAPATQVFLSTSETAGQAPAEPASGNAMARLMDIRAWRQADDENTPEAYRRYIEEHPDGEFVRMAEGRLKTLTDTPEASAERTEQALDLSRDQRREIQRDLSLLDFNTRGIDGIFGAGTRTAISSWQRSQGLTPTGFLDRDQILRLDGQAEKRAAELEAEAERRRQQQLAQDQAYWDETGALGDEAGLRAYLNHYPDGEFSEQAREQLADIERQKRRDTDARDRQLWDEAAQENTIQGYRDYLALSPNGAFRDEAETRIAALRDAERNASASSAAAREEEALNLSPRTRQIVESRLEALGLRPGKVDGVFDTNTRRAIRRYQAARNLDETGYLSEAVVVQLLADSVRQIFR